MVCMESQNEYPGSTMRVLGRNVRVESGFQMLSSNVTLLVGGDEQDIDGQFTPMSVATFMGGVVQAYINWDVLSRINFTGYAVYYEGNMPLILSAGHGGTYTPAGISDRVTGVTSSDEYTSNVAAELDARIKTLSGNQVYPHRVYLNLKRIKLDVNREIIDPEAYNMGAPQSSQDLAVASWNGFHDFLQEARDSVSNNFADGGLLLDIHGKGVHENHTNLPIDWGMAISQNSMNKPNLDSSSWIGNKSAYNNLGDNFTLEETVRGATSLGSKMMAEDAVLFEGAPSQAHPNTVEWYGGYITQTYGSRIVAEGGQGGKVDAVQMESLMDVRASANDPEAGHREDTVDALAIVLKDFLNLYYNANIVYP